jgi:hypothetical protein
MSIHRTLFAIVFASAALVYTAFGGRLGLTIDPDGASRRAAVATHAPHVANVAAHGDLGLTIDPDGRK